MATNTARTGLRLNAALSFATGTLLTVAPATVGGWLDVSIDGWLRALGVALLGHAAILAWVTTQTRLEGWLKLNLAVIAPYPLMMIGLAATVVDPPAGRALVLLDGALVGALAVMQARGLIGGAEQHEPRSASAATLSGELAR